MARHLQCVSSVPDRPSSPLFPLPLLIFSDKIKVVQATRLVSCLAAVEMVDHFVSPLIQFTWAVADPRHEHWLRLLPCNRVVVKALR
jgi:hypothetical protein